MIPLLRLFCSCCFFISYTINNILYKSFLLILLHVQNLISGFLYRYFLLRYTRVTTRQTSLKNQNVKKYNQNTKLQCKLKTSRKSDKIKCYQSTEQFPGLVQAFSEKKWSVKTVFVLLT